MPTGTAFICVSDNGENAIAVAPGANGALDASQLPPLDGVTHLLMQLEIQIEGVIACAMAAMWRGVKVVLNAAPARALPAELLALLDILVVNMGELSAVSGHAGSTEERLERVNVPCVVVTLGERGCCARTGGRLVMEDAFVVIPVDTTAAGDTFCGVLVASLAQGLALPEALRRANAAGALTCLKPGAQSSIPTRAEIDSFLQGHRRSATAR